MATVFIRGKRIRRSFEIKKDAQEFIRDVRLRKLGLSGMDPNYLLSDAFAMFLLTESAQKTEKSRNADKRRLDLALHFFEKEHGLSFVGEVGLEHLQQFQTWAAPARQVGIITKEPWSASTVSDCAKLLKRVFRKLVQVERVKKSPAEYWKVPTGEFKARRAMTESEFQTLCGSAPIWFLPILRFIRLTGARGASVASLTWSDIDFSKAVVYLRSRKGGLKKMKMIPIPMYPELFNLLSDQRNRRASANENVFHYGDEPVTAQQISTMGHQLIKETGLKGVVLYSLRHSLAVDLIEAGVSMEVARQAMGHSNIRETQGYAQSISSTTVGKALAQIRPSSVEQEVPPDATKLNEFTYEKEPKDTE